MAALFQERKTFGVTAVASAYAPERLTFAPATTAIVPMGLLGVTALIESLGTATGATIELWLLKQGGDPTLDASYFYSGKSISSGADTWPLASWPGAQLRAKSAGVAGSVVVNATAD